MWFAFVFVAVGEMTIYMSVFASWIKVMAYPLVCMEQSGLKSFMDRTYYSKVVNVSI